MSQLLQLLGAGGFGAIIGWFVYYINRYRSGEVQFSDITTLVGVLGGGAVTTLYGKGDAALFGAYGVGLFAGFFAYFLTLVVTVALTKGVFGPAWFLDGRRKRPTPDEEIQSGTRPTVAPMAALPLDVRISNLEQAVRIAHATLPTSLAQIRPGNNLESQIAAAINPVAAKIITACEREWETNKGDCAAFVIAVAQSMGVMGLQPPANAIVNAMLMSGGWTVLSGGAAAKAAADAGQFVIGGLAGGEQDPPVMHGHVVVVVSGPLYEGKYPTAYWGSLGGAPYKNTPSNWAWKMADRDRVHYVARTT